MPTFVFSRQISGMSHSGHNRNSIGLKRFLPSLSCSCMTPQKVSELERNLSETFADIAIGHRIGRLDTIRICRPH